ncbi:MAG: hypothetical protein R3Y27_01505 [Clostridia bacterium]
MLNLLSINNDYDVDPEMTLDEDFTASSFMQLFVLFWQTIADFFNGLFDF